MHMEIHMSFPISVKQNRLFCIKMVYCYSALGVGLRLKLSIPLNIFCYKPSHQSTLTLYNTAHTARNIDLMNEP